MKQSLKLIVFALLAFGMMACGEKKVTYDDLKAAEATLFNEDNSINMETAPQVAEKYYQFVKQNPNDSIAPRYLYNAMEINVLMKNADKSIELGDKLMADYPQSPWAPMSLFLLASYVYNDQLNDTAQAHVTFQRLIDTYPDHELVDDAQKSIEYLGLTPEEIMAKIMMSQMDEMGFEE